MLGRTAPVGGLAPDPRTIARPSRETHPRAQDAASRPSPRNHRHDARRQADGRPGSARRSSRSCSCCRPSPRHGQARVRRVCPTRPCRRVPERPTTTIAITVGYRNREGSPADWVRVTVAGSTRAMARVSGTDWKRGVTFRWAGRLPVGSHGISIEAMSRDRFSGTISAGTVTISAPPTPSRPRARHPARRRGRPRARRPARRRSRQRRRSRWCRTLPRPRRHRPRRPRPRPPRQARPPAHR